MVEYEQIKTIMKAAPKTWLITGVAGFIGSNLLEALLKLDQVVVGLDNFSTGYQKNLDEVQALVSPEQWQRFSFIEGDIRNLDDCSAACKGVNFVLHQAALGSVPRSIDDPITTNANNIDGFLNMLVAARDAGVDRFVYAASSSTYGDHPGLPKVEDEIGNPLSPYAVTKVVNELYADVFSKTYGFGSIGLRYFNVFGRRQDPEGAYAAVIPKWTAALIANEDVFINGDGETSRDFCYIDNAVQANLLAATTENTEAVNQVYNVAVGDRTTLNELFEEIRDQLLSRYPHLENASPVYRDFRSGDVRHSLADISKSSNLLGYRPTHHLREGLAEAVDWYISHTRLVTAQEKIMKLKELRVAIIGLGYVGLPLAVEFGKKRPVIGFDINQTRVDALKSGKDSTLETTAKELEEAKCLTYTTNPADLGAANCFIVTVPTPIDEFKRPDLTPLIKASETVGRALKKGDIVIYESTVYPGATEEDCVPVLEKYSGLRFNVDFFCGYSPERINPGDKEHRLSTIKKVTSGSTQEIADLIDALYNEIITAGTHKAESIKVAEAAKVIENTQRDLNIALINELAIIFNKVGIDTQEVLEAAGSKWNFLPFRPGLVGGHCIGVDPYYLTHKAQAIGYNPEIILAGRRMNDGMGVYVASQLIKAMVKKSIQVEGAKILIMGLTFKENCPDLRNTRVVDVIKELEDYNCKVDVYDPWVDREEAAKEYGIRVVGQPDAGAYDAIMLAVAHNEFRDMGCDKIQELAKEEGLIYDLKYGLPRDCRALRL